MRKIGAITATELRVTGQEWTFAPTIANLSGRCVGAGLQRVVLGKSDAGS